MPAGLISRYAAGVVRNMRHCWSRTFCMGRRSSAIELTGCVISSIQTSVRSLSRTAGHESPITNNAPLQTTIDDLIERYDALLFDAYGVLVHVSGAMPGAPKLITRLNRIGKPHCVITNDASRLPGKSAARYRGYGLDVHTEQIVTSGMLLQDYFARHHLRGARCVVLGPA